MGWLAAATNNNNSRALSCVRVCVRGQSEERVLNSRRNTAINQPTSARAGARQAVTASSGVVGGWACVGFFLGGTRSLHRSIRRGVRSVERAVCLRLEMKRETWLLHARRDFGLVSRSGRAPRLWIGCDLRPRLVRAQESFLVASNVRAGAGAGAGPRSFRRWPYVLQCKWSVCDGLTDGVGGVVDCVLSFAEGNTIF